MQAFKPTDFLVARWLAIASAAGAAVAEVFAYFTSNPFWNTVGFVAALFAVAAVLGLWRAMSTRSSALVEAVSESGVQQQALQALHTELEIHRNLERELVEAKQTAESAVMAKGEFLATMSHEIRTPLNGIIPMLDLLMNSKLPPDQHEFLRTAYTSSRQMLRIVDDILDYSKLEANRLQLESTSFNLRELLDSIMRLMEKPAETKGLRLTLQLDPGVRLAVRGDPVRLRQVLTNLISNALKFTERGTVQLVVTRKGETRSQHELRFEVRDTGIGINPANAKNLFRAFAQADASTTRLYGGTGLGLVICKRIVDLMGGQIGVDSETGRGATFWFEIPLLKAVGDVQAQRSELSGGRLLLLSGDPALRQRMQQAAPAWGAQLSVSETTQDALHQLRSALTRGTSWSFDLLLVDLHSVRSTAIALHRNLQRSADFEHLPVAYLKGDDAPSPELSEGPQVLLVSRNMGSQEMRSSLSTFIATPRTPRGGTAAAVSQADDMGIDTPSQVASSSNLHGRVLLVEDNPINQQVARSLIKILGLECETADNGEIALQRMAAGGIDLVLMDCQMPVKDGYSATREWRAVEAARNLPPLPIIAMTANAMAGDRQKCLEAGMDDYLSKPVDRRLLAFCLGRWLQRSPLRNAAQGAPAAPPGQRTTYIPTPTPVPGHRRPESLPTIAPLSPPIIRVDASVPVATPVRAVAPTAAITPAGPVIPILEMEVIEELRSIMGGEYQGLVKLFLEDAPVHIKRLQEAAAASDIAAMVAPAHTLKSSSANLGALALSAVAKRIESGARGEGLAKPTAAVLLLENEFRRAKAALMALSDH